MSVTHPLRSREDLITAFPVLGGRGAEAEALSALAAAGSIYQVLDDAFNNPAFSAALETWSRNNSSLVNLSEAILQKGFDVARRDAIKERRLKQESGVAPELYAPGDDAKWVDRQLQALDVMARSARVFTEFDRIYRGAAMLSDEFDALFEPGRRIHWARLTACTLEPRFTPIHYAWKQRDKLTQSNPCSDVTSYILDVGLGAGPRPPLVWTGAVKGSHTFTTYRWQAEVVTAPGFEFEVVSVEMLNPGAIDRLMLVEATYLPPVSGSPASAP
jgi:hypothetical protein